MDSITKPLAKSSTNSQLLKLLITRCAKSVENIHRSDKDWPGKYKPSLANLLIKRKGSKSVSVQCDSLKKFELKNKQSISQTNYPQQIKNMPLIKISSTNLSLLPTSRTGTATMHSTWRTTQKTNFFTINGPDLHRKNKKPSTSPENGVSFMNKRVSTAFNDPNLENFKRGKAIQIMNDQITQKKSIKSLKTTAILNKYAVDFQTFNYIEKVIDNPEKWTKFVHKKENTNNTHQFLTSVENRLDQNL